MLREPRRAELLRVEVRVEAVLHAKQQRHYA
jgi:hypothetical protein